MLSCCMTISSYLAEITSGYGSLFTYWLTNHCGTDDDDGYIQCLFSSECCHLFPHCFNLSDYFIVFWRDYLFNTNVSIFDKHENLMNIINNNSKLIDVFQRHSESAWRRYYKEWTWLIAAFHSGIDFYTDIDLVL